MNLPISSLNLPEYKIEQLRSLGYRYRNDVDVLQSNISSEEWNQAEVAPKTKTALDIYQEECILGNILTLNKNLDHTLRGGIPIGLLTELCGEPGSGKTRLCFQLCVTVQLPKWCGGLSGKAVYISTNGGFAPYTLKEIAAKNVAKYDVLERTNRKVCKHEFNVETITKNVYYIKITTYIELMAVVKHLEEWLENNSLIRLVIIDSISAPLKLLKGREQTNVVYSILTDLQILAHRYKLATIFTNNLTTKILPQGEMSRVPSLGGSYHHRINLRIALSKNGNESKFTILKSLYNDSMAQYKFPI